MDGIWLNVRQRRRLQQVLRTTDDGALCRRILAILEVAAGRPISNVAELFGVSRQSIYSWIENYFPEHDPNALSDRERSGRPRLWTNEIAGALQECLKWPPDKWGYQAVVWTVPLVQNWLGEHCGLMFSETTIRQQLHALGYTWKRPRYVLEPDPEREKKKTNSPQNSAVVASNGVAV
jgi:transposase